MSIQVTLCSGPTCSSLGCRDIVRVVQKLAARHPGRIEITTQHCFSRCQKNEKGLCPSVRIGDTFCTHADEVTVKRLLREMLVS